MPQRSGSTSSGRATLKDIARELSVDVSTVSKVLNGDERIRVRPETRDRILAEARRVRYQPNASARGLKLSRTNALGMLIPDFTNPIYARIARGAVREAQSRGYVMFMAEIDEDEVNPGYAMLVLQSRIDGFVVATARDSSRYIDELDSSSIPHVFANRRVSGDARGVFMDDERGGAMAAQALIDSGHRRLGLISGPPSIDTARRRRAGFERTALASDAEVLVATGPFSLAGGRQAAAKLLEDSPRPTAIFASNTLSGLGALHAIYNAGLTVPDGMSLITFDDEIAAFTTPALTAIRMPLDELGAYAVAELTNTLAGVEPRDVMIETAPQLIWRDSVAPPSGRS